MHHDCAEFDYLDMIYNNTLRVQQESKLLLVYSLESNLEVLGHLHLGRWVG